MEIESKGVDPIKQFETAFVCAFDAMYKANVPIEVMPEVLVETYKADASFKPGAEALYRACCTTYFKKWKEMNGL